MKRILPLVLLIPAPLFAQESRDTSYNWFDISYHDIDYDTPVNPGANGYSARFSVAVREHVFLAGDYSAWDVDGASDGSTSASVGIGTNWYLKPNWSFYGIAGFRSIDLDVGGGNLDDENLFINSGVRWQVADGYELRFGADYIDYDFASDADVQFMIGGDIYLTEVVTLMLEARADDDETTTFSIGFRFYHDRDSSNMRQRR